jgi:hypothetical protein
MQALPDTISSREAVSIRSRSSGDRAAVCEAGWSTISVMACSEDGGCSGVEVDGQRVGGRVGLAGEHEAVIYFGGL